MSQRLEDFVWLAPEKRCLVLQSAIGFQRFDKEKKSTAAIIEKTESVIAKLETILLEQKKSLEFIKGKPRAYKAISEKVDDLELYLENLAREKEYILSTIERVEIEKTRQFMRTFNYLNLRFSEWYTQLSPGGIAKLMLGNPAQPFQGGIHIEARPRGTKSKDVEYLNEIEKLETSTAFLLALDEISPVSLFISHEIESKPFETGELWARVTQRFEGVAKRVINKLDHVKVLFSMRAVAQLNVLVIDISSFLNQFMEELFKEETIDFRIAGIAISNAAVIYSMQINEIFQQQQ